jgi:NAD(P)H-dependent FMN reductase
VKPRLQVIVASVLEGRVGARVGDWIAEIARTHGGFDVELVDLREVDLPFMDEPKHPRFREYTRPHTFEWSERVEAADAFVFVTAEYNHGMSAPLKNALDYLHHEWRYKPVGFVSYGGVSAGTRAVQMTKQVVLSLRMIPIYEAVAIPFAAKALADGARPDEVQADAARAMLDELARMEEALRPLRR